MRTSVQVISDSITSAKAGVIIHGVNCQGVMGRGVALAIRERWPVVYQQYRALYSKRPYHRYPDLLGTIQVCYTDPLAQIDLGMEVDGNQLWVINAFTQFNYGADGKKYVDDAALDRSLRLSFDWIIANNIRQVHMPLIGCSLGGITPSIFIPLVYGIIQEYDDRMLDNSEVLIYDRRLR